MEEKEAGRYYLGVRYSNIIEEELVAGKNLLKIVYEPWNRNMDGVINRALVDHVRVVR